MKLFTAILSLFRSSNEDAVMDHVPVQRGNVAAKKFAKARAQAAARHGKPFATDIRKQRETELSRDLQEIMAKAKVSPGNVTKMRKAK